MTVPQPPVPTPYSVNSTDASWKAAKTAAIRDKWNTELGAALRAAKIAYDKILFDQLDVSLAVQRHGQYRVITDVEVAKKGAQLHYNAVVKPAIKALETAKSKADWAGRNLVITKAANTKAKQIALDLGGRLRQLKGIDFDDYDAEIARLKRNMKFTFDNYATGLTNVLSGAKKFIKRVRKTPTAAVFNHEIMDRARDITQQLGNVTRLKKNGFDLGKPEPTLELNALTPWAEGHDQLADNASKVKVLKAVSDFEAMVNAAEHWWRTG